MAGLLAFLALLLRTSYFLTTAAGALIGGVALYSFVVASDLRSLLFCAPGIVLIAVPSGRALLRVVRGAGLIPEARLRERWDVAVLVAFVSLLANLLAALLIYALIEIYRAGGAEAGGIAFFAFLDLILYAIALLCGEVVLIGRKRVFVDAGPERLEPTRNHQ